MNLHKNKSTPCRLWWQMRCLRSFALLLAVLVIPVIAVAQTAGSAIKREYFVHQAADEALLIRVTAFEAEIESRVFAPDRILLLSSELPQNRIAPLFQFIEATDKPRQLDIEITATRHTANSEFGMAVTRLAAWDDRSAALMRAYTLLSFASQVMEVDTEANWTVKINSLMGAAKIFDQYGMKELRLWSTYLTAHLIQYRLHDYNLVLGICREIQKETRASQWDEIELATQKLRSAAYIGLSNLGKLQTSASNPDPVQSSLRKTAQLANKMGFRFEQAQAMNLSGLEYLSQSLFSEALEQFQLALEISDSIGDAELSKSIRESIAGIHAGQGDDPATSKVLQEIESQLAEDGGGDELALNLLQQGRIFIRSYRYPQAIKVLQQALNFENDSSIRSRVHLELARAHFETGRRDAMLSSLKAAGIPPQKTASYFDSAYQAANAEPSGFRPAAEALYLRARALARNGQNRQSLEVLEQLIDQVLFLRQSLPGVLGAWYWRRHQDLMEDYLALQVADGTQSLLALSKMRASTRPSLVNSDTSELRSLLGQRKDTGYGESRRRLDASIDQQMQTLRAGFNSKFKFLSETSVRNYLSSLAANEALLTYFLSKNAAYVWLARGSKVTQRKLANASRLYAKLQNALASAAVSSEAGFASLMSNLGAQLLGPVAELLPETIFVIPSGPLLGFPFDALRVKNRYLVESHTVVNLMSFPNAANPAGRLNFSSPKKVFLAGQPQDFDGTYAIRLQRSAGIQAITNIFIGPGLKIIQGNALLVDEFQTKDFQQANLVHLTMPGIIDLSNAAQSKMQLSEPMPDYGRTALTTIDIQALHLDAGLVYLGATKVQGRSQSGLGSQLGLVSDFLHGGAGAVVAQLWGGPEQATEAQLTEFYEQLESSKNIATAVTRTKRKALKQRNNANPLSWVSLQVFVD